MKERYLTIMEVSQKQSYIFSSNKLRDNIVNSAVIAWIMSEDYFEESINNKEVFSKEENVVYSGGGHIVLEFAAKEVAGEFVKKITKKIREEYPGIEVFAKTIEYSHDLSAGKNVKHLIEELERKKSIRKSAFHQGSFGIERIDTNTLKPVLENSTRKDNSGKMPEKEEEIDKSLIPEGFKPVYEFGRLGGSKNENNFIGIVHIDGNAMGKRVENLYQKMDNDSEKKDKEATWKDYKEKLRAFSEGIDQDFKASYKEMTEIIAEELRNGRLDELDIDMEEKNFPVRRIITAGDDICFVSEGRIGIECAAKFIEILSKKINKIDHETYAACAGVAIVHQKYPFYKAYDLAEMLCSNAKKFGAGLSKDGMGKDISVIDWHIEYGEIKDTLEEVRESYLTMDGNKMQLRPYILCGDKEIISNHPVRLYSSFKKIRKELWEEHDSYARSKVKELRQAIKEGEEASKVFLKFHKMQDITAGHKEARETGFMEIEDGSKASILFDAIELADAFISLDE